MVDRLVAQGLVHDPRISEALRTVPRHVFTPRDAMDLAYADMPIPIEGGQTVSAPHIVAMMCEALHIAPGERVLEVGAGSGYHAAVLGWLASPGGRVTSIERLDTLARRARARLANLPFDAPVDVLTGDGSMGHEAGAPYDAISVAAGAPALPPPLAQQLAPRGRLVIPIGSQAGQDLMFYVKSADGQTLDAHPLAAVRFVPLVGVHGWREG